MTGYIVGIVTLIINLITLTVLFLYIIPRLIHEEPSKNGILWASGRIYFDYLDAMTKKNSYGREEIIFPTIINDDYPTTPTISVYTDQSLTDFMRQFFSANLYKKRLACSRHEAQFRYAVSGESRNLTIQIITSAVRIIRRKMLLVTIAGWEFILDPNELLRMYIFDDEGKSVAVRAFDIREQKVVLMTFTEDSYQIVISFDDIVSDSLIMRQDPRTKERMNNNGDS